MDVNRVRETLQITTDGVVHVQAANAAGSGYKGTGFVFYVEDGWAYVLTAAHLVDDSSLKYRIFRSSNRRYEAELVYRSELSRIDIASLKFRCDDCKALALSTMTLLTPACSKDSCYKILAGHEVISMSYGDLDRGIEVLDGETVENCCFGDPGTIRAGRKIYHDTYLIGGDSGSPLLSVDGYVIGLNVGISDDGISGAMYLVDEEANKLMLNILRRAREGGRE